MKPLPTYLAEEVLSRQEGHLRDQLINCFQCKEPYKVLELGAHYATCVKANFKCRDAAQIADFVSRRQLQELVGEHYN